MDICMDSYRDFHQYLKQELQAVSSEEKAASMRRYFPNGLVCIGAISEDINQISAEFIREHDAMLPEGYLSLAEYILERAEFHEEILISYRLIEKLVKRHFDDNLLVRFQYWLENYANNWALVDDLCIKAIYNYLYARPHLIEKTQLWARSEVSWCRRASNVVWVKFIYRKMGKQVYRLNPELVFSNCDLHIHDPDEFVQKSVGWLLKVTTPHHHDAVVNYIKTNIASMQKSTVRYALEKVPKETRDEIMRL
ncbi:DNA alkylation repair enzyme [Shewanella woodyi ATCC 51908]|uniref:DNA alkylation repair enzyme n=2 Tax=Shewanella woodyi TaxID=60961 RepID=B1KRA1_SHEWM|nr:DNA alkylation repair enzyme [Shewanella woodyi ATCC 51908]